MNVGVSGVCLARWSKYGGVNMERFKILKVFTGIEKNCNDSEDWKLFDEAHPGIEPTICHAQKVQSRDVCGGLITSSE